MMWNARRRGVSFDQPLMFGHLSLRLFPDHVSSLRNSYQDAFEKSVTPLDDYRWGDYVDGFLKGYLEASSVSVLDASAYQGADVTHDMNMPVPQEWYGRYDAV